MPGNHARHVDAEAHTRAVSPRLVRCAFEVRGMMPHIIETVATVHTYRTVDVGHEITVILRDVIRSHLLLPSRPCSAQGNFCLSFDYAQTACSATFHVCNDATIHFCL